MTFWVFLVILALVGSLPFFIENIRKGMFETDRRSAPGQIANLPQGRTHYQWLGPQDGSLVICVHGLTTPSFVWGPIADHLASQGFRVLIYDLYGRGYSDRPDGHQDSWFFIRQLDALLKDQGIEERFALVGYSMGGSIVAAYAAARPEIVKQLVLIAPAGMGHALGQLVALAEKVRWYFGRWLVVLFFPSLLRRGLEAERNVPTAIPNMVDMQIAETKWRGFAPAVWSSINDLLSQDLESQHKAIADAQIPMLAIWAEQDSVIPISGKNRLSEWNAQAKQIVVPNAEHSVAYTKTEAITAQLDDFLDND